ncbi:histidinol-phosphatase [Paenalkalicoccus suaedae]|uniref:Histidinol-phosphatase n=1 Tax=Paenalkalicoccus suaedae TaxID=2592382 RepID=A0A859FGR8_9BACI|nr:histidinol-phosphatase [Paenalkalicoccus suaedae]QKS72563.1 histidinol-phosphatase [Paenalkalicoccus suaedae]
MTKVDLHTHHYRCGHASGDIHDYIEAAISQGFVQIGITDHNPFFHKEEDDGFPGMVMKKSEFSAYIGAMKQAQAKYADKIEVLLGVEGDYFEGHTDVYKSAFKEAGLDYYIGAVHYVNGKHIFDKTRWSDPSVDVEKELLDYYTLTYQMVAEDFGDIVAHMDALKAFAPAISSKLVDEKLDQIIQLIGETKKTVEINTSGLRKCKELFPSKAVIKKLAESGASFTFGSDSHDPKEVGYEYDYVAGVLKGVGVTEWAVFRQGKREFVEI